MGARWFVCVAVDAGAERKSRDTMSDPAPLPAYEAPRPTNELQPTPAPGPPLVAAGNPDIGTTSFFGGGGVRIPLSATEKAREDLRSLSHLASFGIQVWVRGFDELAVVLLSGLCC
jgi:hypothetical protein